MSPRASYILVPVLAAVLGSGGCATVIAGKYQTWQIESEPTGATVLVDGQQIGQSPVAVRLRRNKTHSIELRRAGCQTRVINLRRRVNGWFWMNFLWGYWFISLPIDAATGAMWELMPTEGSWGAGMMLHEGSKRMYLRVPLRRMCRPATPVPPPPAAPPPPATTPPAGPPPATKTPPTSRRAPGDVVNKRRHLCRGFTATVARHHTAKGGRDVARNR